MGDDSCLILWDARSGTGPAVKVVLFSILSRLMMLYVKMSSSILCTMLKLVYSSFPG